MAAEGRRNGNGNVNSLSRILNGETARMNCNCEKAL